MPVQLFTDAERARRNRFPDVIAYEDLVTFNWLRVLDTAESSQVDQRVGHQLHAIMPFQGGAQLHRHSCRVTEDHTKGIASDDEVGSLLDRRTHALTRRITTVGYGDIPWRQGEMLERFARVDIADEHLEKLQGHQVHRDMEAMIGAVAPGA